LIFNTFFNNFLSTRLTIGLYKIASSLTSISQCDVTSNKGSVDYNIEIDVSSLYREIKINIKIKNES
jgi:hypothetical protein